MQNSKCRYNDDMNAPLPAHFASRPLYEEVAERLRQLIFSRELATGAWIDESVLTAQYGISRTPLREAIKVLATEGLITMKPRRGAYVTEVSEQDLREVFELLALLESDAAGVVAAKNDTAVLTILDTLHAQLVAAKDDREAFFAVNEQFHTVLLQASGNRWRQQCVADLRKVMKLNRHHSLFKTGRVEESLKEHAAIMAALRSGDAQTAVTAMRRHMMQGLEAAV
jgi:DNA-binding GntR family transcriptional regulator